MRIILPQNPVYYETLENIDLYWQFNRNNMRDESLNMVIDTQTGLLKHVDSKGFEEYIFGGEFDEQLGIMDEETIINDICGLPSDFSPSTLINGYLQ